MKLMMTEQGKAQANIEKYLSEYNKLESIKRLSKTIVLPKDGDNRYNDN